ncbi:unnamed protein product, partial [Mesorhabditis belari]|uniref:NTR domain-containing protein n=1 Tax=Mesorhabditis belari TaxID=2138241 RepID=A0AAF3EX14_9BILA
MTTHLYILVLFARFLWATSNVPSPVGGTCNCPMVPTDFIQRACALNWISQAQVVSSKTVGQSKTYTLKHLHVFKGDKSLPTQLLVENTGTDKSCTLSLANKGTYLLGGLLSNGTQPQLTTSSCLSLAGLSPVWSKVPAAEKKQLNSLKCPSVPPK